MHRALQKRLDMLALAAERAGVMGRDLDLALGQFLSRAAKKSRLWAMKSVCGVAEAPIHLACCARSTAGMATSPASPAAPVSAVRRVNPVVVIVAPLLVRLLSSTGRVAGPVRSFRRIGVRFLSS